MAPRFDRGRSVGRFAIISGALADPPANAAVLSQRRCHAPLAQSNCVSNGYDGEEFCCIRWRIRRIQKPIWRCKHFGHTSVERLRTMPSDNEPPDLSRARFATPIESKSLRSSRTTFGSNGDAGSLVAILVIWTETASNRSCFRPARAASGPRNTKVSKQKLS